MATKQTNEIIIWLEDNYPQVVLSLSELKALLEIEHTPEPDAIGVWAEKVPQQVIAEMIREQKESGEYYVLDNKVKIFKESISKKYK